MNRLFKKNVLYIYNIIIGGKLRLRTVFSEQWTRYQINPKISNDYLYIYLRTILYAGVASFENCILLSAINVRT